MNNSNPIHITENAVRFNGAKLDVMREFGHRGGCTKYYRRADRRNVQVALWHRTKAAAAAV